MNKQIQELYKLSWIPNLERDPSNGMSYESKYFSAEKFAELIVRACADAADMAQEANCEYAGDYVAESLGFGEEEGATMWRFKA